MSGALTSSLQRAGPSQEFEAGEAGHAVTGAPGLRRLLEVPARWTPAHWGAGACDCVSRTGQELEDTLTWGDWRKMEPREPFKAPWAVDT